MKVLRGQEASLESSEDFYRGSRCHLQKSKPTSMQSLSLLPQRQQLHLQSALTSYHRSIEGRRGWRQRRQPVNNNYSSLKLTILKRFGLGRREDTQDLMSQLVKQRVIPQAWAVSK